MGRAIVVVIGAGADRWWVITDVKVVKPYVLDVTFADGDRRRVDIEPPSYGEMFEPLRDEAFFRQVAVDAERGTIVWPNGADLSPEFLHEGEPDPVRRS